MCCFERGLRIDVVVREWGCLYAHRLGSPPVHAEGT